MGTKDIDLGALHAAIKAGQERGLVNRAVRNRSPEERRDYGREVLARHLAKVAAASEAGDPDNDRDQDGAVGHRAHDPCR